MPAPTVSSTKVSSAFMDPKKVITAFGVEKGDVVADFGAGVGYFALPLAKPVIPKGKVYAVDVMPDSLDLVKSKANVEGLSNLEFIRADLETENSTSIKDSSVNFVIIVNTLFQLKNKTNIFREAKRVLKPGGKLVIIDWMPGSAVMGPADTERVSIDQVRVATIINGFKEIKQWVPDAYHYGLIFIK